MRLCVGILLVLVHVLGDVDEAVCWYTAITCACTRRRQ